MLTKTREKERNKHKAGFGGESGGELDHPG